MRVMAATSRATCRWFGAVGGQAELLVRSLVVTVLRLGAERALAQREDLVVSVIARVDHDTRAVSLPQGQALLRTTLQP